MVDLMSPEPKFFIGTIRERFPLLSSICRLDYIEGESS
jgi:hypothetical protein